MLVIRRLNQPVKLHSNVSNGVAADLLGIHPTTLNKFADSNEILHTRRMLKRKGGERVYKVSDIIEFAKSRNLFLRTELIEDYTNG